MNKHIGIFCILIASLWHSNNNGYGLPYLGLGSSSFLDGGPLRQVPGWYFEFYNQNYTTHRFLDNNGKLLGGIPSPHYNLWATAYEFIYLSDKDFLGIGNLGFDITLPVIFYSHVQKNSLGFRDSSSGLGDLVFGVYAQPYAHFRDGNPFFVQRFEFDVSIPSGRNKLPDKNINPGNGVLFLNPYWAATLYLGHYSVSWQLNYLWVADNHRTHLKAGDTVYVNFAFAYEINSNFFAGINGYFLQQLIDNRLDGIRVPGSRERVLGIGFGGLYSFERHFTNDLIINFYWETAVKNRSQGFNFFLRYIKHF